jgi:hypothetical protein
MVARSVHVSPQRERTGAFELVEIDEDHAKAITFNMVFMTWRYNTHVGAYRRGIDVAGQLGLRFPEGVGVFHIVEAEALPPSAMTRKAFVEFLRLKPVKHFSVTHEGTGFKAASVRAIVASVHALGRPNCEHSVHKSVELASEWHAQQQARLGRSESAQQISRAMNKLRALHRERYP